MSQCSSGPEADTSRVPLLLRASLCALSRTAGFSHAEPAALDFLADLTVDCKNYYVYNNMMIHFYNIDLYTYLVPVMDTLSERSRNYSELATRTSTLPSDIELSLFDLGLLLSYSYLIYIHDDWNFIEIEYYFLI